MSTTRDISNERLRIYTYPDGFQVKIEKPVSLQINRNMRNEEVHKIVSMSGEVNVLEPGWRTLRTLPHITKETGFNPDPEIKYAGVVS